jgi:hypothetical protein
MPKSRERTLEQLEVAKRHVISAASIIARQRALVVRLAAGGLNTKTALGLLQEFEKSQAIFEQDCADLERELREVEN